MKNKNSDPQAVPVIVVEPPRPTWQAILQLDLREIGLKDAVAMIEVKGDVSRLVLNGHNALLRAVPIPSWCHPSDREILDGKLHVDCDPIPGISQEQASAILNALQPLYEEKRLPIREFPAGEKLLEVCRARQAAK